VYMSSSNPVGPTVIRNGSSSPCIAKHRSFHALSNSIELSTTREIPSCLDTR
jgi:hypothetical protein